MGVAFVERRGMRIKHLEAFTRISSNDEGRHYVPFVGFSVGWIPQIEILMHSIQNG